jgi:hypothetical protein
MVWKIKRHSYGWWKLWFLTRWWNFRDRIRGVK